MDIKVSVIIPIYNVEQYLGECLQSVLGQTLSEIEVICINDRSTDASWQILLETAEQDPRIKVINNKKNLGLSAARNAGMREAVGKYIYFLDSDDKLTLDALERFYQVAEAYSTDIVFCDSLMFYEDGDGDAPDDLFMAKCVYQEVMSGAQFLGEMYKNDDIREPVWLQFWNREFLERIGLRYYEGILHEDLLFTFVSLIEAERVKCINEQLHFYRIRAHAITSSKISERHILGLVKTYVAVLDHWDHRGREKGVDPAIGHYLDRISWKVNRYLDTFQDRDKVYEALGDDGVAKHMFRLILEPQFKK